MTVTVTTSAQGEVLSLSDVKQHLRVDHTHEDALITSYFNAAVNWIEDACSLVFLTTGFTAKQFDYNFNFLSYPNAVISSVKYTSTDGAVTTVDSSLYYIKNNLLTFDTQAKSGFPKAPKEVEIIFTAGYGASNIPEALKVAALLLATQFFENRDVFTQASQSVLSLLAPYRRFMH